MLVGAVRLLEVELEQWRSKSRESLLSLRPHRLIPLQLLLSSGEVAADDHFLPVSFPSVACRVFGAPLAILLRFPSRTTVPPHLRRQETSDSA